MFYKKDLRNNKKGITLIALIVTIIVLLILAGVSISMLSGENGIINQAKRAKNETENAARQEEEELAKIEAEKNGTGIPIVQVKDEKPGELEKEDDNTFVINSIEDLVFFSYDVRNGNTYEGKTVKLVTNLDFKSDKSYIDPDRTDYGIYGYEGNLKQLLISGEGFIPIGSTYDTNVSTNYFSGTFNGNYNYICNLYQNYEDSDNTSIVGLFSTNNGTIENLRIENCDINVATNNMHIVVGTICGRNMGNISNCGSSGNINIDDSGTAGSYVGGIVGQAFNNIESCYSRCTINFKIDENSTNAFIGGVVGGVYNGTNIKFCYNIGNIVTNSIQTMSIGGILGSGDARIENCYNNGKITINAKKQIEKLIGIGNIVGTSSNDVLEVNNCFNLGEIEANLTVENNNIDIGNIIGNSYNLRCNNCYNCGNIIFKNKIAKNIGQITGSCLLSTINNCYGIEESSNNLIGYDKGNNILNDVKLKEKESMPNILEIIGSKFKEDTNNINNGYPILEWE